MDVKHPLFPRRQPEAVVSGVKRSLGPVDIYLRIKSGLRSGVADPRLNRAFVLALIADGNQLQRELGWVRLDLLD